MLTLTRANLERTSGEKKLRPLEAVKRWRP
jgi:hypothetical protein